MNRRAQRPHWEDEFIWSQWSAKDAGADHARRPRAESLAPTAWESAASHYSTSNPNGPTTRPEIGIIHCSISRRIQRSPLLHGRAPDHRAQGKWVQRSSMPRNSAPADVAILRPTTATLVAAPDGLVRRDGTAVAEFLLRRHCVPLMIPEEHIGADPADSLRETLAQWPLGPPMTATARDRARVIRAGGTLICSSVGLSTNMGTRRSRARGKLR